MDIYNTKRQAWALAIIRIMLGAIFIAHGAQKVLGIWGGPGLAGFVAWIGKYGVPPFLAYLAAFAEFIGGFLLLFGILPELGALCVIPVMLGAVFIVHWQQGFFGQHGGYEYPLSLAITTAALILGVPDVLTFISLKDILKR